MKWSEQRTLIVWYALSSFLSVLVVCGPSLWSSLEQPVPVTAVTVPSPQATVPAPDPLNIPPTIRAQEVTALPEEAPPQERVFRAQHSTTALLGDILELPPLPGLRPTEPAPPEPVPAGPE